MASGPINVSPSSQQRAVFNAQVPEEGPLAVTVPCNFAVSGSYIIDFTVAYERKSISVVQQLWFDNFINASPCTVTVDNTGQVVEVPANSQGSYPLIGAIRPKITIASAGTVSATALFLNVPLPIGVWYAAGAGPGGTVTVSGTVPVSGTVSVTGTVPVSGTVALSGTSAVSGTVTVTGTVAALPSTPAAAGTISVATAGTAVTAFAANSLVNGGVIKNPSSGTATLFVDCVNAAQTLEPGSNGTTYALLPGDSFTVPAKLTTSVSVNANASATAFVATAF